MAERPDFIPQKDSEWFGNLMDTFDAGTPVGSGQGNIDGDSLSPEEQANILVADNFIGSHYKEYIETVEDVDIEAEKMRHTFTGFAGEYPDVGISHVVAAVKIKQFEAQQLLDRAGEGSAFFPHLKIFETHFANLSTIAERALELEQGSRNEVSE